MPEGISHSFSFHAGLESVFTARDLQDASLPGGSGLDPSEEAMEAPLQDLLSARSLESRLLESLKPMIPNREILLPGRYHSLADDTQSFFDNAAQHAPDEETRHCFREAASLLKEEQSMRDLLLMYRHSLHKA